MIAIGMFIASIPGLKTKIMTELIDCKQSRDRTEPGKQNAWAAFFSTLRLAGFPLFTRN